MAKPPQKAILFARRGGYPGTKAGKIIPTGGLYAL